MGETLGQLGENELLHRLARFAPAGQLDDDTAQVHTNEGELLINTDVTVSYTHLTLPTILLV